MPEDQNLTIELPADIDDSMRILQLVGGLIDGKPFWAYLAMFPSKYQDYALRTQSGEAVDLADYGDSLEQGWGSEPPQDVQDRMARDYGAEPDFENDLAALLAEAGK